MAEMEIENTSTGKAADETMQEESTSVVDSEQQREGAARALLLECLNGDGLTESDYKLSFNLAYRETLLNQSWRTKIFTLLLSKKFGDLHQREVLSLAMTILVELQSAGPEHQFWEAAQRPPSAMQTTENATMMIDTTGGRSRQE